MANVQTTSAASDIFSAIGGKKGSGSAAGTATQEVQDRFLTLLVTQLKNQDPLNPLDNAAVTTQLAQINTVTGIEKLNTTLATLMDSFANTQAMEASAMIGKSVLSNGSLLSLANGNAFGGVNLASAADQVKISILNGSGQVVQTQNLGAREAGTMSFVWDGTTDAGGKAADGAYKFTVEATVNGEKIQANTLQLGTVNAVSRAQGGFVLDLGAMGSVDFKDVQQIL